MLKEIDAAIEKARAKGQHGVVIRLLRKRDLLMRGVIQ